MGNLGFMEILLIIIGISIWAGFFAGIRAYIIVKRVEKQLEDIKSHVQYQPPKR